MQVVGVAKLEVLDREELARLDEMYEYGNVATIGALVSRCRRLREVLELDCRVEIRDEIPITLTDPQELRHWLSARFDTYVAEDVFKAERADAPGELVELEARRWRRSEGFRKTLWLIFAAVALLAVLRQCSVGSWW